MQNENYQDYTVNAKGLVNSIKLTQSNYLFPVYEAVINSIQSIHSRKAKDGKVSIYINRPATKALTIDDSVQELGMITGFVIQDNGIGFDHQNFSAFHEVFTENKIELGGKGVGRFMMLAAFNNVSIDSVYFVKNENKYYKRSFNVTLNKGTQTVTHESTTDSNMLTTVTLSRYKSDFLKNTDIDTIARKIVEHCLAYFINNTAPNITIYDDSVDKSVNLNELFEEIYEVDDVLQTIDVNGNQLKLNLVKNFRKNHPHQVHYCANDRVVEELHLNKLIPVLTKHNFKDENDKEYALDIYCRGDVLNKAVDNFRDVFTIPKKISDKTTTDVISLEEISIGVKELVETEYSEELTSFADNNKAEIVEFINRENLVEYRHLLENDALLMSIPAGLSDNEKDTYLHKANYELERSQKQLVNDFLTKNPQDIQDSDEYQEYFSDLENLLQQEHNLGSSRLAKYMMHRKTVIKVFEKFLEMHSNETYKHEADIHDIIFKRNTASNEVNLNSHNLWILDERLAYYQYIASDKKFKEIEVLSIDSEEAADLFVYDNKFTYGLENEVVVLFEFKRPMRTNYKKDEKDLGGQIKRYVTTVIDKQKVNHRGRPHQINDDTPKFGYVICDYTADIEKVLARENYKKTPNGTYFKYEDGLNLYIEIMTYDQLLKDVNLRHKAFFSKLGIDTI